MKANITHGDARESYESWPSPTVIVSDGAYGVGGFPTDTDDPSDLRGWYEPHVRAWSEKATPATTLWIWNTERGWAEIHPLLEENGWEYRGANIWNKGIQHVSGNTNTDTIRKFPVVTEMCVQYVRSDEAILGLEDDERDVQEWIRDEWKRADLTFSEANEACGVASAATRKWFAADNKWYFPPPEQFERLREYANEHGDPDGKPYLSTDKLPYRDETIHNMGASKYDNSTFDCPAGVTNVWEESPVRGGERIELPSGVSHPNQKPISLMSRIITTSSERGDVVWEPFGGLCTASVAAVRNGREAFACEIEDEYFRAAERRLSDNEHPVCMEAD
jgi:site-specific DNA-methyltransferase (adenine-specific)